jgi:hypothetical protein
MKKLFVVKKRFLGNDILFVPVNDRFSTTSFSQKDEMWCALQKNIIGHMGLKGTVVIVSNMPEGGIALFCPFSWEDIIPMKDLKPIV